MRSRGLPSALPGLLAVSILVAALLPAFPSQAAPGPNARPPLSTPAPILALAMADDGMAIATTEDPGSSAPTPGNPGASVNTWHVWSPAGVALRSGSGDLAGCASRLQDLCQSPVPAAAMAASGARYAFVANVASSVTDSTQAMVYIGDDSGIVGSLPLSSGEPQTGLRAVSAVMDHDGDSVAVLERLTHLGGSDTSRVEWFDISDANVLSAVMPAYPLPGVASGIALSDDGERLAAAADKVYLFTHTTSPPSALGTDAPRAVAIAGGSSHGLFWGVAGGTVTYAIDGSTVPRGSDSLGTSNVTAVAVSRDGKWAAAGNAAGHLRVYALNQTGTPALQRKANTTLPDMVAQLAITPDGRFILVRSLTEVRLFSNDGNLTQLWRDTPATAPTAIALSASGDLAGAAVGSGFIQYPAVRGIRADPLTETILPGQARTTTVTYRNNGNRPENATLEVWFPAGWFVTATPTAFDLPIDGVATVELRIVLPAREPPGGSFIFLNHTTGAGATGTSPVKVEVASRDLIVLDPVGPTSLAIRGGQTVEFVTQVENRGNRDGTGHLKVSVEPASWQVSLSKSTVSLAPGAKENVTVTLTAPAVVTEGDAGRVRLVLEERPQEPLLLYGTVGARFDVLLQVPAQAPIAPGNSTLLELTVQNKGNVVDSFDMALGNIPDGWVATWAPGNETVRNVEVGGFGYAYLQVTAPTDATPGLRAFWDVTATSQGNPSKTMEKQIRFAVSFPDGEIPPEPEGSPINWPAVGGVALVLVAVGSFVGGYFLLRRK